MKKKSSWKQFCTVLGFELRSFLTNKGYLGITIFLVVALAVLMFLPRVIGRTPGIPTEGIHPYSASPAVVETSAEKEGTLLLRPGEENATAVEAGFVAAFPAYEIEITGMTDEEIRDALREGEAEAAFLMNDSNTGYTYVVNNLRMYDRNTVIADEMLKSVHTAAEMDKLGVSGMDLARILGTEITHEEEVLNSDQGQNFFYTYIMIFALYMVIIIYGQIVAGSVASEKTSRAMELLITSARTKALMFGKIIAAGLAGLIQLVVIFGAALLFYRINVGSWGENEAISSMFNIPPRLLIFLLVFFVLGYFLYACLFGAFGSTVSKTEDVQMATMPAMFGIIIMFMVVIISISSGSVDNPALVACSFIPFTSPMAMFARIAMGSVPAWQIVLSIGLLVAAVYAVGVLAAKIYRMGVLLYGNAMKPGAVLKALATSEKAK